MRCIFCKKSSDASRSKEHIVPESLGNKSHVLPAGVVCDQCNNYFARKIEGPLLAEDALRSLRFHQAIANKSGRIPPLDVIVAPGVPGRLYQNGDPESMLVLDISPEDVRALETSDRGLIVFPGVTRSPDDSLVSRFLGKCGLEALAERLLTNGHSLEPLVDHTGFDLLRGHVRRGSPLEWTYSMRRIYDQNHRLLEGSQPVQRLFEYDLLLTTPDRVLPDGSISSEMYFVLALFGLELAINMGGSDLEGYSKWLEQSGGVSPLYWGKNR
jgi:hypothetical protein